MRIKTFVRYFKILPAAALLGGLSLAALSGCGPSAKEIAQRQEAMLRAEAARAEAERVRQEEIAARQAKLLKLEQDGDKAAEARDVDNALADYKELLNMSQDNRDEDQRVREKIIKFVATLKTPPPVPEEARRYAVRAQALVKTEQSAGFAPAAAELSNAVLLVPWWADGYYNLGLMQEGAEDYGGAVRSLKLCLLADPHAANADAIQNKIYELEVQKEEADKVQAMAGTWTNPKSGSVYTVSMNGKNFEAEHSGWILRGVKEGNVIEGTITVPGMALWSNKCVSPEYTVPMKGQISPDGRSITFQYTQNNYASTHWNITGQGIFGTNRTGHNQGDCISVTLQGTSPDEFTIAR